MTSTLDRPTVPRVAVRRPQPPRSPLAPGIVAASWAVGAGLVTLAFPVLLTWATDSRSGSGSAAALRSVGQLWLLAHGTSMTVQGGVVGLTPLGLLLLPLALLHRAGRHGARSLGVDGVAAAARLTVAVAFPYALAAAVVAALSRTPQIRPAPVGALLGALLVAVVGAASGIVREATLGAHIAERLPARLRQVCVGTAGASAVLLGGGALLAALSLLTHAGRASSLAGATDPGVVGGLVLLVAGLACVPNAAVWGASWLAGPGFAVGVGTAVGPFGTTLGAVPALPLFAALPASPAPVWLAVVGLVVPVCAGLLGGALVARRLTGGPGRAAREALLLGPAAGALWSGLAYASGGPLGSGRLSQVGPSPWQVGLAVAVEVGLSAAAAAAVVRR